MSLDLTPMMRQYLATKEQHPDAVLFFQLGDFFETFFEDATLAARELDIVLTQRDGVPMAGVPVKKADIYINRLLKRGHKVAICEQVEDARKAKGMVRRRVTRVVTPGTVLEEDVLDQGEQNYLVSVLQAGEDWALAACDASTGEFRVTAGRGEEALQTELVKLGPRELLLPERAEVPLPLEGVARSRWPAEGFEAGPLLERFSVESVQELGLSEAEGRAAGALVAYLAHTQQRLNHLRRPVRETASHNLKLDPYTVRNLELVRPLREGSARATLLAVLNRALTGMGQRRLRHWMLHPLRDRAEIERRLDAVEALRRHGVLRAELRELLRDIYDLERLAGRLGAGRATPQDLLSLKRSLARLPQVRTQLATLRIEVPFLSDLDRVLAEPALEALHRFLEESLRDDAAFTIRDGGVIRPSFHPELTELQVQEQGFQDKLLALEAQERARTGISSLKVGYNAVFGYFLEVPKSQHKKVPPDYHRKQTLSQAERYVTPELKAIEEKLLAAQERAKELEYQLFLEVREATARKIPLLQKVADALARVDALAALAEVAARGDYVRPRFVETGEIHITAGRHPVVESLLEGGSFVPNDLKLKAKEHLVILTGPNMSGKSTYLRQVALIALLAQMGSFVPAQAASLPVFDQIFTRVGASDMLAGGISTFMAEMLETAHILRHATAHSLILLDEMGRGTSTFDGVAIAWAVADYLARRVRAKTLFATHYHELTQLAEQTPGVVNLHVRVQEVGEEIVFLHQVAPGAARGSYGVHVAQLAGVPLEVTEEAERLLKRILAARPLEGIESGKGPRVVQQLALFRQEDHPALQRLKALQIEQLTPLEALERLAELKALLER